MAASVVGFETLSDEDDASDFGAEPSPAGAAHRTRSGSGGAGGGAHGRRRSSQKEDERQDATMDEMFVEFFDAIDELSDNDELEGTSGMGLGLVIPKLKTDQEIAAHYSVPLPSLQQLKVDFPECPAAELSRFLARKSVSGDVSKATKLVAAYLEWRRGISKWPAAPSDLPNPFRFNGFARDGSRLLLLLPCSIDISFKPELYCQKLVRSLDVEVERSDLLRFTVLLDCRPHTALGYDAKPVWRLWTHISAMAKIFQAYFPERLQRFVIYPAGDLEMGAFRMFKGLLSTETVKRVRLLYSKLGYAAAAPPPELLEILDVSEIRRENKVFFTGLEADGSPC